MRSFLPAAMETGLLAIVDWFERLPTLVIAGAGTLSSLTRILIGTTVDVLGERLLRLPLNADGEQPFCESCSFLPSVVRVLNFLWLQTASRLRSSVPVR